MISSTTVSAGEKAGSNSAYAIANSRGNLVFFIRALLNPGVSPRGKLFLVFYAASRVEAKRASGKV
jgi:hypothetical protein